MKCLQSSQIQIKLMKWVSLYELDKKPRGYKKWEKKIVGLTMSEDKKIPWEMNWMFLYHNN